MSGDTPQRYVIGVDVGGTFTDVFVLNEVAGKVEIAKVPTTAADQSQGFLEGIRSRVSGLGDVMTVVHGTTVATNALLERKGARTGVITTMGFRDVLEMRRRDRPRTWGLWGTFEPIVPRDRRLEVAERVLADGTVREAVDPKAVRAQAKALLEMDCEALSIVFINSYANAENEQAAKRAVLEVWPNEHITVSSDILPEIREFERASTATLNAMLQPTVGRYLAALEGALRDDGFTGEVLIVQSNGGVMSVETARARPVRTALSGPAAGVIAAAYIGEAAGFPNLVTCDMGGTSFDVSLVADGRASLAPQTSIGFGMVVRSPMIETITIGAGGGSIARVDAGGLLQVGPESAGSEPGPVCYGLGNDRPTVTDANVVLGRINAERPIGGRLDRLDVAAAEAAILKAVGEPLRLGLVEAADAILRVANAKMASAIRLVSIERGHDPKEFAAMPFGGGGALHAGALIRDVGLSRAVVPRFPGVTSALGCVIADMRHDHVHTINRMLEDLDIAALDAEMVEQAATGHCVLDGAGVAFESRGGGFELDMLYFGQTHTVSVRLPVSVSGTTTGVSREIIQAAFEESYRDTYGRLLDAIPMRVMNLRSTVIGRRPRFDLSLLAPAEDATLQAAARGKRRVHTGAEWVEAGVHDRLALPVGAVIVGPALLEQLDATIYIEPGLSGEVDRFGNVLIAENS
ncbi:hydantoinase/oxoprolinase family protein [Alphaproteobacteria bacterium]|nr:hydantoinase/oxoprolinase family protein [Alphaproteobacteria bacterium]